MDGVMPIARLKCWRMFVEVPKPLRWATSSIEAPVDSSSCRERATRCWITHCCGVVPTASLNHRWNAVRLIEARAARSGTVIGPSMFSFT